MSDAEKRLDKLFRGAFELNHPAMRDWMLIKFELKKLRAAQVKPEQPPTAPACQQSQQA